MGHFAISPGGKKRMVFRPQAFTMIGCGVLLHIAIVVLCIFLQAQSNRIWMWTGLVLSLVYTGFLWKLLLAWKVHFSNGGDSWESLFVASSYLPVVAKAEDEEDEDDDAGGSSITHKSARTIVHKKPITGIIIGNLLVLLILINIAWIGLFVTLRQSMPHSCRGWTFLVHSSHAVSRTPLAEHDGTNHQHPPPTWELNNNDKMMESMLQHDQGLQVWAFTEALPQTTVQASKTTSSFGMVPATQTLLFAGKDPTTMSDNMILWEQPSSTNEDALPIAHENVVSPTAFVPVNPTTVCFAQDNITYPLGCFQDGTIRVVPPAFDTFSSVQQKVVTSNLYASGNEENDLLWFQGYTLTTKGAYIASFNVTSGQTTLHSHLVTPNDSNSNTSISLVPPPLPQQQERYIPAASCSLVNNHRRHRFGSMASLWMGVPLWMTCVALWIVFWHNLLPIIPLATLMGLEVLNLTLNAAVRPGEHSFETGIEYGHVGLGIVGMTTVLAILHTTTTREQKVIWMPTLVFATVLYLIGTIEIFLGGERGYQGINWIWINLFAFMPLTVLGYGVRLPGMTAAGLVGVCFLNAWKVAEVVAAHAKNDDAVFLVGYILFAAAAWGAAKIYQRVSKRSADSHIMTDSSVAMPQDSSQVEGKQSLDQSFESRAINPRQRLQLDDAWSDEEEETITLDNNL